MSEKSGWFGHLLGRQSAKPLPTSAKRCANGHPMALDWRECPYCKAADTAAERTRVSDADTRTASPTSAGAPGRPGATKVNDGSDRAASTSAAAGGQASSTARRETKASDGAAPPAAPAGTSSRRHTSVLDPDDATPAPSSRAGGGRRLTGIVFTFSWSRLGQLFDIRDGRNFIGSGVVGAEGNRPVDVLVTEDDKLSGAHFLILCQGEKYRIRDLDSTNGTFLNGEQIDSDGTDLPDGSLIQAGATLFAFQKVRPPALPATRDGDVRQDESDGATFRRPEEDTAI